jgi:hypothetical protein
VVQIRVPKNLDASGLAHVEALAEREARDVRDELFE